MVKWLLFHGFSPEIQLLIFHEKKLGFDSIMKCMLSMESGSLAKEMLEYFDFSPQTPSASAYN